MADISLAGITKAYGGTTAIDDVSLDVADGELLVLLGPSGCGKSTLLRIIAGLIDPDRGRVRVGGRDVTTVPPRDRNVAMVFQSFALYPHLSVRRNLGFGLRARRRPRREIEEKVADVARRLGLEAMLDRRPRALSGGQRQRVALGRAMVRDPAVFLMDEPLSNLDAQLRTATRTELAALHRSLGATFVYVTHDQVEAMTLATRIAVLYEGRLEQVGTPAEIYDEPASVFVARFVGAPPMNLLPAVAAGRGGQVLLQGPAVDAVLCEGDVAERPVLVGVRPERLRVGPADPGQARFTAQVTAVENLGSEEVAVCAAGDTQVCVRGPRPLGLYPGQDVELTASADDLQLFDPASGHRLVWVPDQDADRARTAAVAHDVR
ncbi:MAG TPA: ABC transporter ATP-binding protein [Trebonia sp.]|jgi:multiple sugar transport system ATP-binding protein|nr:ABC transporter ATP-binding protein [Trebonia sp.]